MIMQTPSITTSLGSEGMHLQEAWPGAITDDVDESDQANFQVMAQRPSVVGMEVIAEEALESQLDSD